jgi:hypothetical protein
VIFKHLVVYAIVLDFFLVSYSDVATTYSILLGVCVVDVSWSWLEACLQWSWVVVIVLRLKSVEEMCLSPTGTRTHVSHVILICISWNWLDFNLKTNWFWAWKWNDLNSQSFYFVPESKLVYSDAWLVESNIKGERVILEAMVKHDCCLVWQQVADRSINRKLFANLPGRGYMDVITVSLLQ